VLAVYGAGYLRTQEAALLLESEDERLGPGVPALGVALAPEPASGGAPPPRAPGGEGASATSAAGEPAAPDEVRYRDGLYTGMGRSRHGNIEATVEILEGRIVSATISSCRTRYPCSQIEEVVPQVAERQHAYVDNVSGATVSVTAFYRAVVQALKQAE
jgi:uncharacterized protein with FMN-binding domain